MGNLREARRVPALSGESPAGLYSHGRPVQQRGVGSGHSSAQVALAVEELTSAM